MNGTNKNGESNKAGKAFFNTDHNFFIAGIFTFAVSYYNPTKEKGKAP